MTDLAPGQKNADAQACGAGGDPSSDLAAGRQSDDAQRGIAGRDPAPGQSKDDARPVLAGGASSEPAAGHSRRDAQTEGAGRDGDGAQRELTELLLRVSSDALDGLERERIATGNRLESLRRVKGMGGTKVEAELEALHAGLLALEHEATLSLQRALRRHPLGPWVKQTIGVGEKQGARLLAALGDPGARPNPAKLWQYAGHGDPARSKLRRGQRVEHSPVAKMRVRLVAISCMRTPHSPYRAVYDRERARWADRDTTDGHKHAHALRVVGKAILLDLWREGRRASEVTTPIPAPPAPLAENVPAPAIRATTPILRPPARGDSSQAVGAGRPGRATPDAAAGADAPSAPRTGRADPDAQASCARAEGRGRGADDDDATPPPLRAAQPR